MEKYQILTERFLLRPLTADDVSERYSLWFEDESARKHIVSAGASHGVEDLRGYVAARQGRDDVIFWGIFAGDPGVHIGNIKYEPVNREDGFAVMGILVGDPAWRGKGVAGEVLTATGKWLKEHLGIGEIVLGVDRENVGAIKAYERVGFREESTRRITLDPESSKAMVWRPD